MDSLTRMLAYAATALAMVTALAPLTSGTALAGAAGHDGPGRGGSAASVTLTYATHAQTLSANGTSVAGAACPTGTHPAGGGTTVQDPRAEQVVQASFYTSTGTGRIGGYEATVAVRGLQRGSKAGFVVQVACLPASVAVVYAVHALVLTADGTSWWGVPCPAGTTPSGGGTAVGNPRVEDVRQAGFHASAGRADGYEATVTVRGLARGKRVPFVVQVACLPAWIPIVYAVHTLALTAGGTTWWGAPCPAVTAPAGGGTAVASPRTEHAPAAGFHRSSAGRFDGYGATVQVSGLPRRHKVLFAVQAACLVAAAPPTYGPAARALAVGGLHSLTRFG